MSKLAKLGGVGLVCFLLGLYCSPLVSRKDDTRSKSGTDSILSSSKSPVGKGAETLSPPKKLGDSEQAISFKLDADTFHFLSGSAFNAKMEIDQKFLKAFGLSDHVIDAFNADISQVKQEIDQNESVRFQELRSAEGGATLLLPKTTDKFNEAFFASMFSRHFGEKLGGFLFGNSRLNLAIQTGGFGRFNKFVRVRLNEESRPEFRHDLDYRYEIVVPQFPTDQNADLDFNALKANTPWQTVFFTSKIPPGLEHLFEPPTQR